VPKQTAADTSAKYIFEDAPVKKAVSSMVMPTIISQLVLVVYNMADTWYVGLTNNANAVAAISLCLPVYSLLTALSNLFGIGGAGVVARAMGRGDDSFAHKTFVTAVLGAFSAAAVYSLLIFFAGRRILFVIGADNGDIGYAVSYVRWTIAIGGIPTILTSVFGHLVRSCGNPKAASFGMMLGAFINILLDPLFMFVVLPSGHEVTGAAVATAVSNVVSLVYFLVYILRRKNGTTFSLVRKSHSQGCFFEILRGGMPGFCMVALAMLSNCFLNSMLSTLGSDAVAGIGIVRKIDQLAYAVNQGVTQGMLPIVAYCYAHGNFPRMKQTIVYCALYTFVFSFACMCVSIVFAPQLISFFIRSSATIFYGSQFLRVICISIPVYSLTFVIIAVFQAVGRGIEPFILSFLHKGTLDIFIMFYIYHVYGVSKITFSSPVSETAALITGIVLLRRFLKKTDSKCSFKSSAV